ncbi:MAG: Nif11 family protein [Synechococcaceae bacterium WB9_2_170]|nr:Nif11 family protein [Synechococcaceae bacterium WB9_2_170]
MSSIVEFVRLVEGDSGLQARIKVCSTPAEVIALAAEHQCVLTAQELRKFSRDLSASYWPWSARGYDWRRQFFAGS